MDAARGVPRQARLHAHAGAGRRGRARRHRRAAAALRHPEARRDGAALRLPARARRRAAELGGSQGPVARHPRQAARGPRRGPPVPYADFEGTIPEGEYGGGTVLVWDTGTWTPVGDPHAGLAKGDLKFNLHGTKLNGLYVLVHMKPRPGEKREMWLLIKERDEFVRPHDEYDVDRRGAQQRRHRPLARRGAPPRRRRRPTSPTPRYPHLPPLATRQPRAPRRLSGPRGGDRRPRSTSNSRRWSRGRRRPRAGSPRSSTTATGRPSRCRTGRRARSREAMPTGPTASRPSPARSRGSRSPRRCSTARSSCSTRPASRDSGCCRARSARSRSGLRSSPSTCCYLNGRDVRELPLVARKELLRDGLSGDLPPARRCATPTTSSTTPTEFYRPACLAGLEGIVCKRAREPLSRPAADATGRR